MLALLLIFGTLASAVLHIQADYAGAYRRACFFKPATVLLIMAIAVLAAPPVSVIYQRFVVAALIFSVFGDVFLMLRSDRFVAGLVSFLIAHLVYIAAFSHGVVVPGPAPLWLGLIAVAVATHFFLLPHLGSYRIAGTVYLLAILGMVWMALLRFDQSVAPRAEFAAAGALLFLLSDTSLAVNRFVCRYRFGQLVTLGTYYAAQLLIALSIGVP